MGALLGRQRLPGLPQPSPRDRAAVEPEDRSAVRSVADRLGELARGWLPADDLDAFVAVDSDEVAALEQRGHRIGPRAAGQVEHRLARLRVRADEVARQLQRLLRRVVVPARVLRRRGLELDEVHRHPALAPHHLGLAWPDVRQQARAPTHDALPAQARARPHLRAVPRRRAREDHHLFDAAQRAHTRVDAVADVALLPEPPPPQPAGLRRREHEREAATGVDGRDALVGQHAVDLRPKLFPGQLAVPACVGDLVRRIPEQQVHRLGRDGPDRVKAVGLDDLVQQGLQGPLFTTIC